MPTKQSSKSSPSFDSEELTWPEPDEIHTEDELLQTDGMFKFSKIKDLLQLSTADLTKITQGARKDGISTYQEFGFGKPKGSQYIVRMSRFRDFYRDYMAEREEHTVVEDGHICSIPANVVNANQLIEMEGLFYLREVCNFSPFKENEEVIKRSTREENDQEKARERNGCWHDKTKREYFVDMQLFVPWFFKKVWINH